MQIIRYWRVVFINGTVMRIRAENHTAATERAQRLAPNVQIRDVVLAETVVA